MNSTKSILTSLLLVTSLLACDQESTEKLREDSRGWEMVADLERLNKALETQNQLLKANIEEYKRGIRIRDTINQTKDTRLALFEKQLTLEHTALNICRNEQRNLAEQVWVYENWVNRHRSAQQDSADTQL